MNKTNVLTGAVAVIALVFSFLAFTSPGQTVVQNLGGSAGPFHTEYQQFSGDAAVGGGIYATTTTAATETLTGPLMDKNKTIRFLGSATAAAITATLPASTTFPLAKGEYRTWVIENGYTAAATTTTIAAGTGIDLQEPDGQNVVIGINNYAFLTCFREASTDVVCAVDETIPAD